MRVVTLLFAILVALSPVWARAQSEERVIRPGDVFSLTCEEEPSLNRDYTVTRDGLALLPFVGAVAVGGLTEEQAATRIANELVRNGILRSATITVRLVRAGSEVAPIRFAGAVEVSGELPFREGLKLSDVLAVAKPTAQADLTKVSITSAVETVVVDFTKRADSPDSDPLLKPGDRVFVPRVEVSPEKPAPEVYVLGAVRRPGAVRWEEGLTLRRAIEAAGGLAEDADSGAIRLERAGQPVQNLDWNRQPDEVVLAPSDRIVVAQRRREGYVFLSGEVFRPGAIEFESGMTLSQALRAAGGARPGRADLSRVSLTRRQGLSERTTRYNALRIQQGLIGDVVLQPGDRIDVPRQARNRIGALEVAGAAVLLWILFGR